MAAEQPHMRAEFCVLRSARALHSRLWHMPLIAHSYACNDWNPMQKLKILCCLTVQADTFQWRRLNMCSKPSTACRFRASASSGREASCQWQALALVCEAFKNPGRSPKMASDELNGGRVDLHQQNPEAQQPTPRSHATRTEYSSDTI